MMKKIALLQIILTTPTIQATFVSIKEEEIIHFTCSITQMVIKTAAKEIKKRI